MALSAKTKNALKIALVSESLANEFELLLDHAATTVDADSNSGQPVLNVASTEGFLPGDTIIIDEGGAGDGEETKVILSVQDGASLTLTTNLANTHTALSGDSVARIARSASEELKRNLEIAMADVAASDEVLGILQSVGSALSGKAKNALRIALTSDQANSDELISQIES